MARVVISSLVAAGAAGVGGFVAGGFNPVSALAAASVAFSSTLILGAINSALYKEEKTTFPLQLAGGGQSVTVREANPTRQIVFGKTRAGGAIFHLEETGKNKLLHFFIAFAGHRIQGYELHYFGQDKINIQNLDASDTRLIQNRFTNLQVNFVIETNNSGRITRGINSSFNFFNAFGADQLTFQVIGSSFNDGIYRRVITRQKDIDSTFIRVERIDNGLMRNENSTSIVLIQRSVWVQELLGTNTQNLPADLTKILTSWKSANRALGVSWVWYYFGWYPKVFPNGIENIGALIEGNNEIWDPRSGTTGYSDNVALCLNWYLTHPKYGPGYAQSEIKEISLIAAANVCDEPVPLAAGGTEKRYTCNGRILTSQKPSDVRANLLAAMAGKITRFNGQLYIYAGAYQNPIFEITESDLRDAPIRITANISRRALYNGIKGTYISPANDYEPTDFQHLLSDTFRDQDGGDRFIRDISMPFTTSETMAQRIARIELLYIRQQQQIRLPCKWTVLEAVPGSTITLTLPRYGLSNKAYEVLGTDLIINQDESGIDLQLKETDPSIYDWDTSIEQKIDPAPDTNLPTPWFLEAPTSVQAESGNEWLRRQADGTIVVAMHVEWDQGGNTTGMRWIVSWRLATGSTLQYNTQTTDYPQIDILGVQDGQTYEIYVEAINSIGVRSPRSELILHTVSGNTEPPPDLDSFEVYDMPSGIRRAVFLLNNPPADLFGFELRYRVGWNSIDGQPSDWEDLKRLFTVPASGTNQTRYVREFTFPQAPDFYTFRAKALDRSGNESVNSSLVETELLLGPSGITWGFDFKEEGWPGVKTNCHVEDRSGDLMPNTTNTWSNAGSWLTATTWGANPEAQYIYDHPDIDLGTTGNKTVTFAINIQASSFTVQAAVSTDGVAFGSYQELPITDNFRYIRVRITAFSIINP